MTLPCPACVAGALYAQQEFEGGYLHPSHEYVDLLHCNACGAYYRRIDPPVLLAVPPHELAEHRRVSCTFR